MKVKSDVKGFKGYVVLPDYLNILQVRAFEDAFFGDPNELQENDKRVFVSVSDSKLLPLILDLVEEWHIDKLPDVLTVENFPATPVRFAHEFITLIGNALYKLWVGESESPNE